MTSAKILASENRVNSPVQLKMIEGAARTAATITWLLRPLAALTADRSTNANRISTGSVPKPAIWASGANVINRTRFENNKTNRLF